MQEIPISNPPVFTGICDPNKSGAQHHHSLIYVFKPYQYEKQRSNSVSDLWGQQIGLDLDPKWG